MIRVEVDYKELQRERSFYIFTIKRNANLKNRKVDSYCSKSVICNYLIDLRALRNVMRQLCQLQKPSCIPHSQPLGQHTQSTLWKMKEEILVTLQVSNVMNNSKCNQISTKRIC